MAAKPNHPKFQGKRSENERMTALALRIGQGEFTDRICDAIRRSVSHDPSGVKAVARAANANVRTVENWFAKRSTPAGLHLVRLMATMPEVQSEVRRLASMESDLDPAFERDFNTLVTSYMRLKGGSA